MARNKRERWRVAISAVNLLMVAMCVCGASLLYLNLQSLTMHAPPSNEARHSLSHALETSKKASKIASPISSGSATPITTMAKEQIVVVDSKKPLPPPDGHFNSIPVYYKSEPLHSSYSCIGENFRDDAWLFRSCTFRNLCFDTTNSTFVLFPSREDQAFGKLMQHQNISRFTYLSTTGTPMVSLGGINPKWSGYHRRDKLKWFPRLETEPLDTGYYEFPPDSVWLPFHSFAGYNAGHLFWDDFFPIFKLLSMFDLLSFQMILTRIEVKLWGTCDWNPKNTETCKHTFGKFLPAMGLTNDTFSGVHNFRFNLTKNGETAPKSKYICSPRGTAGLGMLTDHGLKMHGWDEEDFETTHNVGRGQIFYDYRNFILRNLEIPTERKKSGGPYNLVLSRFSSSTAGRVKGFGKQQNMFNQKFLSNILNVTGYRMSAQTLHAQAEIASQADIFVTVVGGGAMTATFLPRGSSLILYYEATGGRKRSKDTGKPAPLDWDVLNHASHLRVHWLPVEDIDTPNGILLLEELVRHEMRILDQLR